MENSDLWDDEKEREARSTIRREVLKAFALAEKEKKPPLRAMFEGVYEELSEDGKAERLELARFLDAYPDEYDVEGFEGGRDGL